MRSVLDSQFDPSERFDLEELHEQVLRQFHDFRRTKGNVPEWATDRQERINHAKKWEYINGRFAAWLAQLDQQTMVGSKLNEKFDEIEAEGEAVNWDYSTVFADDSDTGEPATA